VRTKFRRKANNFNVKCSSELYGTPPRNARPGNYPVQYSQKPSFLRGKNNLAKNS
jgi:hypothetical protein